MNFALKILAASAIGFAASGAGDLVLWLKTPGGWKANRFDLDVASKRWVLGAVSAGLGAAGLHVTGL